MNSIKVLPSDQVQLHARFMMLIRPEMMMVTASLMTANFITCPRPVNLVSWSGREIVLVVCKRIKEKERGNICKPVLSRSLRQ